MEASPTSQIRMAVTRSVLSWIVSFGPCLGSLCSLLALGVEGSFEFESQLLAVGQVKLIFRDKELIVDTSEGVFDQGVVFRGAKQDAYRRVVVGGHHVLSIPAYISIELADILVVELIQF